MVFSSILFIFLFLPIVICLYYLSKDKYKNIILLIASLLFYSFGEPQAFWIMLGSIIINYVFGILVAKSNNRKRLFLILDIIINVSILFYYKYFCYSLHIFNVFTANDITIPSINLPIGISFFTFQAMSYVIDIYRGDVEVEMSILNVGLYISFFPQLVAGPIIRYSTISNQIKNRTESFEKFGYGAQRFIIGFGKKIILANNLAAISEYAFLYDNKLELPVITAWIGSIAFSLQIFFDFSGYSDMAIGLGKMFGFDFSENFNYPYASKTVTEFWHRWHISLSRWFRDYVYFPLGGSRVSSSRHILNLFLVWILTGLWHGANITFVLWGFIFFIVLVFEKKYYIPRNPHKIAKIIYMILTLLIVNFEWVIFNSESVVEATRYIKAMFGLHRNTMYDVQTIGLLREYNIFIILGILFSTPITVWINDKLDGTRVVKKLYKLGIILVYFIIMIWSVSFLVLGAHNPFIYFNF